MDLVNQALATDGLVWLILAATLAGVVRGFSGFGTAMIFLPVAGQILDPISALILLMVMDVIGPLPKVPQALKDGHPGDIARLGVGLFVAYPIGIAILTVTDPDFFRYSVSFVALALLAALLSGFRYRGTVTKPMVYGVGLTGGFLGGVSGIPGPPVILFYMASPHPPSVIRANNMVYLVFSDVALFLTLLAYGLLNPAMLVLGLMITLPYMLAIFAGSAIFRPEAEKTYRYVAYAIIGVSAIRGLPIWG